MLKNTYHIIYAKASRLVLNKKFTLFSDIVLLIGSAYLLVKKVFDFSISGWLLNHVLQQTAVNMYVAISIIILVSAFFIKALSLIFEAFPITKHLNVEPEEISECLQVMNNEIMAHIKKCDSSTPPNINKFNEQHSFDINTRLIAESLSEHIKKSIDTMKIKRKDLFISLYTYSKDKNELEYELHFDPKRDLIKSKRIFLNHSKFENYECVKCMKSSNSTAYQSSIEKYSKGNSKRFKTFTHYLGCKLETNGNIFGFLNIEFHNQVVFIDEDEMQDFMEENIFPFKLLFEYQYLKGQFFNRLEELDKNWELSKK
jgi:NAD-dependent SIR2 family protein deacetylase